MLCCETFFRKMKKILKLWRSCLIISPPIYIRNSLYKWHSICLPVVIDPRKQDSTSIDSNDVRSRKQNRKKILPLQLSSYREIDPLVKTVMKIYYLKLYLTSEHQHIDMICVEATESSHTQMWSWGKQKYTCTSQELTITEAEQY